MTTEPTHPHQCDFCLSDQLQNCYTVPDSARGMVIQVCEDCGLVQSKQTKPNPVERIVSTSSGAMWGNIRHGKGLRLEKAISIIKQLHNWDDVQTILDIGSNRGDFIQWAISQNPQARITAVEPDKNIVDNYKNIQNVNFLGERFENTNLPEESFDFIYLSHTLEHANSASAMLAKIWRLLRPTGTLFLEVPNLDVIDSKDIFEEFFIDKHQFHFERRILIQYLQATGYEIITGSTDNDQYNITLLASKTSYMPATNFNPSIAHGPALEKRLAAYKDHLAINREKLKLASQKIIALASRQKVAFWGAGRQFDALVRFGNLDTSKVDFLVDEYLWKYLEQVHGVMLHRPEELKSFQPQVVIILARGSENEIIERVRRLAIKNVIKLRDLIQ